MSVDLYTQPTVYTVCYNVCGPPPLHELAEVYEQWLFTVPRNRCAPSAPPHCRWEMHFRDNCAPQLKNARAYAAMATRRGAAFSLLLAGSLSAVAAAVAYVPCAPVPFGAAYFCTSEWGPGSYVLWVLAVVLGYAYVSGVSCGRANPFASRDGRHDCAKLAGAAAVGYWLSGVNALFSPCFGA